MAHPTEVAEIHDLERKLGAPENFFSDLARESDWSFLIKLSALLEAALSHLITSQVQRPELNDALESMNLRGRKLSKIAVAKSLQMLDAKQAALIEQVAALRNTCAHEVANVNLDLRQHVASLNHDDFTKFVRAASLQAKDAPPTPSSQDYARADPKELLWLGAMNVLIAFAFRDQAQERARLSAALHLSTGSLSAQGFGSIGGYDLNHRGTPAALLDNERPKTDTTL